MAESIERISVLRESRFGLDGGAMFGIVPKPLWSRAMPPDEANRIRMACNCLLIEYDSGRRALVDVGMGTDWSEKERGIYNVSEQDAGLAASLERLGLEPDSISDVILTHLHFDHAGGLRRAQEGGGFAPSFPRATHWVQRRQWSWAHAPSARDGGSFRTADFDFFEREGAPALELVDGIAEILPGLEVLPLHGHTFGMQAIKITREQGTLLFAADLIPTSAHLHDAYVMGYDIQPLVTVAEKRALLYEAHRGDWTLIFSHDPDRLAALIELDERGRPRAIEADL